MIRMYIFATALLAQVSDVNAKTWHVGSSRTYTKPSQVSSLVSDGDTVVIDAGTYESDVCKWTANNLVITANGGIPHMRANGTTYGGKGIWVIDGKNCKIDSIEFSLAACVDKNGAGIRLEAQNLTVLNCYFHDNENGILCGADTSSTVWIEGCYFEHNGAGDGYSHNLYIGNIGTLVFQYNYSFNAKTGHELKSRANRNFIRYNRFEESGNADASRSIDLPQGGLAVVAGNELIKGVNSQNSNFIEFGQENLSNPAPHKCFLINNTFISKRSTAVFFYIANGAVSAKVYNNVFTGTGNYTVFGSNTLDTSHNRFTSEGWCQFSDATNGDYRIAAASPLRDAGTNPGSDGSIVLQPDHEFSLFTGVLTRNITGSSIDIGAHEFWFPVSVHHNQKLTANWMQTAPETIVLSSAIDWTKAQIIVNDLSGRQIPCRCSILANQYQIVGLPQGIFTIFIKSETKSFTTEILVR